MDINSRVLTCAIVGAMGVGSLGLVFPALASAAHACDGFGAVTCIYDGSYSSRLGYRSPGSPRENISVVNRNKLSSWINDSGTGARFYYKLDGMGTCVPMYAHNMASASSGNPDNNEAESHAYTRIC